jgi:hypothetical protein
MSFWTPVTLADIVRAAEEYERPPCPAVLGHIAETCG